MDTTQAIQVVLLALVIGAALPLLVQLFTTVRQLHRSLESLERRVDRTLEEVSRAADRMGHAGAAQSPTIATISAALGPALVAGLQAYKASRTANGHAQSTTEREEKHHEREQRT